MEIMDANINEDVILQLIIKSNGNELASQPSGYPKLNIFLMNGTTSQEILPLTQMVQDIVGEYQYKWTTPLVSGFYKIKYTAIVNELVFYEYDYIRVTVPEDAYSGVGK